MPIAMGRIKTMLVKRTANKLFKEHKDSFSENFDDNKKIVMQYADVPSKKLKNVIAGYLSRLAKRHED